MEIHDKKLITPVVSVRISLQGDKFIEFYNSYIDFSDTDEDFNINFTFIYTVKMYPLHSIVVRRIRTDILEELGDDETEENQEPEILVPKGFLLDYCVYKKGEEDLTTFCFPELVYRNVLESEVEKFYNKLIEIYVLNIRPSYSSFLFLATHKRL